MSTQQLFGRIAEGLNRNLGQGALSAVPDFSKFTVSPLKGQGATSTRYRLQFADEHGRSYFVKKYTTATRSGRRQLETEYQTAKWLAAELGAGSVLQIDPPLLMIPDAQILVATYVTGQNLSPYFSKRLRWHFLVQAEVSKLKLIAGQLGSGLAELQRIPAGRVSDFFGNPEPEQFFAGIKSELNRYRHFYMERRLCLPLIQRVVAQIELCLNDYQCQGPNFCFQHNDYILQNLIVGENGKLQLFDFANSTLGIPCFDMAHMLNAFEDLTYLKSVSAPLVAQLKSEFLKPFCAGVTYQPRVLAAMRAYIQLYSGTILLRETGRKQGRLARRLVRVDPAKRLKERLTSLLAELER